VGIFPTKRLWLDLGDFGVFAHGGAQDLWQDHGLGVLRTIMHQAGVPTDIASTRAMRWWWQVRRAVRGYDQLFMNVRSYTFPFAYRAAKIFKEENPKGLVLVGGMHATVALDELEAVPEIDYICQSAGENVVVPLALNPESFPRIIKGISSKTLGEWPMMDRTLWPNPQRRDFPWPLEPSCGWGPPPVATVLTSRVCPWQCVFCSESSYIPNMGRKPVDQVIDELNYLDDHYGPLGSVVIYDSMFFQQPRWLEEWLEKYPKRAHKVWPYWAGGRADTVRQWPDLFEALVRETNWDTVSLGFESGSTRVLNILNKETTAEDNDFSIDLVNELGDKMEAEGKKAPVFWANIMLGIPGETREDAFATIRMLRRMKRVLPSISYYAPYPGSILGHQLIAEGRSNMTRENYHRYAHDRKVKGIDYDFYDALLKGKFDREINAGSSKELEARLVKA